MEVMGLFDMKSHLIVSLVLLITFHYESAADCKLDISSSILLGRPMFGERLGPYNISSNLTLTCSISKGDCGKLTWLDAKGTLLSGNPTLKLSLGPCDEGRRLQCTAEGKAAKTVQLVIKDAEQNSCITTKAQAAVTATTIKTSTATSTTKASKTTQRVESTSFAGVEYDQKSNRSTHDITKNSKNNSTAQAGELVYTVAVRQGTPVPATVTSGSAEEDNWTFYLIMGGVIVVGGLALATLISTSLLFKKVYKAENAFHPSSSSSSAEETSEEPSSVENTRVNITVDTVLEINNLPPITPLIVGKLRVGESNDPLLRRGVASDDMDHSYYYPEDPDSYYYPGISQDVKEQILRDSN